MKKVLALVLAVMMMATVAFAAIEVGPGNNDVSSEVKVWIPGSKIKVNDSGIHDDFVAGGGNPDNLRALNSTNYAITKTVWEEGRNLVESVKFDNDNDQLVIKLKQDYTLTTEKTLKGTITLKGKKVGKADKPEDLDVKINTTVGYILADGKGGNPEIGISISDEADIRRGSTTINSFYDRGNGDKEDDAKNYLWKVVADDSEHKAGSLEFDCADDKDTNVEVRVYDGDKLYLYNDVDPDTDILKKYADVDADLTFLNFPGEPTFNATATVRFYKPEGTYIYQNKDGVLSRITAANAGGVGQTAGNVKWDDDEGCYVLRTRTLGKYVFSDKPLNVSAASDSAATTNPDTGANDIVGIASALAAVALVSAAAVSLKK